MPNDSVVVNNDNWDVPAIECTPQLSNVDMQYRKLGHMASQALLRMMNGERETGVVTLPVSWWCGSPRSGREGRG